MLFRKSAGVLAVGAAASAMAAVAVAGKGLGKGRRGALSERRSSKMQFRQVELLPKARPGGMETVLLADNARLSRQLVEVQTALDLKEAVASEKIQHLESTIQALTRQSTNDAFTSAKRVADLERQVEALKTGGGGHSVSVGQAPGCAAPGAAGVGADRATEVEAKYAQLLSSLQDEWEREKGRLQRELGAEKDRANEAVLKATAERKRLTDALSARISTLTKQVSGDVTGLGKRCEGALCCCGNWP
jgi:hypothetical protein